MDTAYIESPQNNHVKNLVKLRDRKHRNRQDKFIIEGQREIEPALASDYTVNTLYYCPEYFNSDSASLLIERIKKNTEQTNATIRMHPKAFSKCSLREGPDGFIALSEAKYSQLDAIELKETSTLLILEGIEKPGNLGAIIRSADGAGVDAIVLDNCSLDCYNPNAIRASQGLLFRKPIVSVEHDYLITWLKKQQFTTVATSPRAELSYSEQSYPTRTALVMGSESHGLSEKWLGSAERLINIPMLGAADSLNVSVATAICLYEIMRQKTIL